MQRPAPGSYADALTWVRLALALDEGHSVRWTTMDNAPSGRPVHWSGGFAWLVAGAGQVQKTIAGESLAAATEHALAWFNLPFLLTVVLLGSAWAARRVGPQAGMLLALGMVGHPSFYGAFAPNNVDHHGLLAAASLGLVLGAMFMGAGWWRSPEGDEGSILPGSVRDARRAATGSAVAGAVGMWLSAASVLPIIALIALAGLGVAWGVGGGDWTRKRSFAPEVWRWWGRLGGGLTLVAYFLEYWPPALALRLEVNHPLYAVAWLGAGELIATVAESRQGMRRFYRALLAGGACLAAPIVIALGGASGFAPLDPRQGMVHANILEFRSMFSIGDPGSGGIGLYAIALGLLVPVVIAFGSRQRDRVLLRFVAAIVVGAAGLAVWQVRWWQAASGPELALFILVFAVLSKEWTPRGRWIVTAALGAVFLIPATGRVLATQRNVSEGAVTLSDAMQPLYRDVAAALRASQPTGNITLLAGPSPSTGIGYFGGFNAIGTLYWENLPGLEAAAAIFSAPSDEAAYDRLRDRGITHIAMVSNQAFLLPFLQLAQPGSDEADLPGTFGYRLLNNSIPQWLRAIPFRLPLVARQHRFTVLLFQVIPDQTEIEALENSAAARLALGDTVAALRVAWNLATSSHVSGRDGQASLRLVLPLAKQYPDVPVVLEVLAAALAEVGRFREAVQVASKSIFLYHRNPGATPQEESRMRQRLHSYEAARPWREPP
jgi:hypothetical protein